MALAPDQWDLIASGDSNSAPNIQLPSGRPWRLEIDLPFAVPDAVGYAIGNAIAASLGALMTISSVTIAGALLVIEGPG